MSYPVQTTIKHPDTMSRGMTILQVCLGWLYAGIPHGFCLFFRGIATGAVVFCAFWAVLFTGQYPRSMFEFVVGTTRWVWRLNAYLLFLTHHYPPFSGKETDHPAKFTVTYPKRLSRALLLVRFLALFYVLIPHGFLLWFRAIGTGFVAFIAFWIVLFTGRYPADMFEFVIGHGRWINNVRSYLLFETDAYPPFTGTNV